MEYHMVKIDDNLKERVILYLCDHDGAPNKDIENALTTKAAKIDGSSISRVLVKLASEGFITTNFGMNNEKPRSLKRDFPTLHKLVLEGTYLHGRGLESTFLQSKYWNDWIPELVNEFATSFDKFKLSLFDIRNAGMSPEELERARKVLDDTICPTATTEIYNQFHRMFCNINPEPIELTDSETKEIAVTFNHAREMFIADLEPIELTDSEKKEIAVTLKSNWSMLRFVIFYLSLDTDETRRDLMLKIAYDAAMSAPAAITLKSNWSMLRFVIFYLSLDTDETRRDLMPKIAYDAAMSTPAAIAQKAKSTESPLDGRDDKLSSSEGDFTINPDVMCEAWYVAYFLVAPHRLFFLRMFERIENMRNQYPFVFTD